MKLQSPDGAQSDGVFVGGGFFPADAQGCIEVVEEGDWSMLFSAGWTKVQAPAFDKLAVATDLHKAE